MIWSNSQRCKKFNAQRCKMRKALLICLVTVAVGMTMPSMARCDSFEVYETDKDGNVSFRYQGDFGRFYCTKYLMPISYLLNDSNPNNWKSSEVTDWLPTWKGEKLMVPKSYQDYHKSVYGYSIDKSLVLETK